jgi:GT2 family glycosyltransferase
MHPVDFTVAICTHNHLDHLAVTLPALGRLLPPEGRWELLIIDNASSDGTAELLGGSSWHVSGVDNRVVREAQLGVASARNRAALEARGDYLLFLDDDETPAPDWLQAMERHIRAGAPDAIGGPYRVVFEGAPRPAWLQDELLPFLGALDHGPTPHRLNDPSTPIWTGNAAFKLATLRAVGLFDPNLGRRGSNQAGGEDTEMYRRLVAKGCHVRWAPDAVIFHRIRATKLRRRFFLSLHFRQGMVEACRRRGNASRIPPLWLYPQLSRAILKALARRVTQGANQCLRLEMNVSYFLGYFAGWMRTSPT